MPKKRILPYIILGILSQKTGSTGKEITNQFTNEIGEFWKAAHSQVYPELRKMEESSWIEKKTDSDNDKEKYYYLSDLGRKELAKWIRQPVNELPVNEDLFSLKLFFIDQENDPRISILVNAQLKLLTDQLEHLQDRQNLLFSNTQQISAHYGHYLILQRALARLKSQIAWLKTIRQR